VVIATGYEAQAMLREKVVNLNSTYALVTQPLDLIEPWNHQWIMWQAKDPYLYLRTTADSRLLVGGEDDEFQDADKRDASIPKKSERLIRQARYLLGREDLTVDRSWAGTFGETRDGLAYIGQSPEYPNCHFALGFGGNGITFSTIAADLLADQFTDGIRTDIALFRFGR
jgi:glycine/D-amino acid oxidase-like deaminating enzyme